MPGGGEPWEELEYRELLGQFSLSGRAPSGPEAAALAGRLDRSLGALEPQWNDARTYCLGRDSTVASDQLKSYLDRNNLCRGVR